MTPALLAMSIALSPAAETTHAIPLSPGALETLDEEGRAGQADHMWRLVGWSGAQLAVGGGALASGLALSQPMIWGFGAQLLGWAAIDLGIAVAGLYFAPQPTEDRAALVSRELFWSDVLLLNAGLDAGYVLVGLSLVTVGLVGAPLGDHLIGHGAAVAVAGAGLLVLDVIAFVEALDRRASLTGAPVE